MGPFINDDLNVLVELSSKHVNRQSQLSLLELVSTNRSLCSTQILSSLNPSIGKIFHHQDLEKQKQLILSKAKQDILKLSITEAERDLSTINANIAKTESEYIANNVDCRLNHTWNPDPCKQACNP